MIIKKVLAYIRGNNLATPGDILLVALSGGADSVALLRILIELGYQCEAAHCNFQLRGDESERDEAFVRNLCREHGIYLNYNSFDTREYASANGISIEMAARELRYEWFEIVRNEKKLAAVAVAHHRDDSAETMLLNLIRGTGIHGLTGIRPKNGHIIRPLLSVSRDEIIEYLHNLNQSYVTDSTNLQDEYTRNKIRLQLIPVMERINPSIKETLIETGNYLSETEVVYNCAIEESKSRVLYDNKINIEALCKEPSPQALLFEILHPLGFNATVLNDIYASLDSQPGKQFFSHEWRVIRDRDYLLITPVDAGEDSPPFKLIMERTDIGPNFTIPRDKKIACLDAAKAKLPLTLRKWENGDLFVPFGMSGKKKVSDYLTDRKFSLVDKEAQWVLCKDDDIVWLVGERIDNRYRIDPDSNQALIISLV